MFFNNFRINFHLKKETITLLLEKIEIYQSNKDNEIKPA